MRPTADDSKSVSSGVVERSLETMAGLATLPKVALEIIRLANDDEATADDFCQIVRCDPALCVRVLKVVNSAFYGLSRQIESISQAVVLLGATAIKNIAIASSVHKLFVSGRKIDTFDPADLWLHSVAVATASREIARRTKLHRPEDAFLAGLIHDVGILVELQAYGQQFVQVVERVDADPHVAFRQAERELLGASHEAFGAGLCQRWSFPRHLEQVAAHHHEPERVSDDERTLPAIVHLADWLSARAELGYARTVEVEAPHSAVLDQLNLSAGDIDTLLDELPPAVDGSRELFSGPV